MHGINARTAVYNTMMLTGREAGNCKNLLKGEGGGLTGCDSWLFGVMARFARELEAVLFRVWRYFFRL
jgi:hypothetical protein